MDTTSANSHISKSNLLVEKLPSELLGRIFILGTDEYRSFRKPFSQDVGFQDIVIRVCRRWREVGLQTPTLWASIFVQQPQSYQRSKSGNAVPLARQTLEHIVSHGGNIDRWRSLVVRAKNPEALFEVVGFINSSPTPALQFLSLKRCIDGWDDAQHCDRRTILPAFSDSQSLSSGHRCPQLSRVELLGLTSGYIFRQSSPMLSNLRHLKHSCSGDPYPVHGIGELLSASPQLEYLSLDLGAARCADLARSTTPAKVVLPSLRSFSLRVFDSSKWGEPLLKTIDAPAVGYLRLSCKGGGFYSLLDFLCTGRLNGVLRSKSSKKPQCGPVYPSLRHLHFDYVGVSDEHWEQLLEAYSMITEVTLDWVGLLAFVDLETALPNLSYIRYSGDIRDSSFIRQLIEKGAWPSLPRLSIPRRGTREDMDGECKILGRDLHGLVDRVEVYDDDDFTTEFD